MTLTPEQVQYLRDHAEAMWAAFVEPPSDSVEAILAATCRCCARRRAFVASVLAAGEPVPEVKEDHT